MKLSNEFEVAVPLERAWEALLDIERVAQFLPGATIEPGEEQGVYQGSMRVKVGPMVANYKGTARLGKVDEDARSADIEVQAKEARGQGTAAAVIRNQLVPADGGTRVVAETDLQVTGKQAQFGRGIMQDVAGKMLDQFADRFERYLLEGDAESAPPAGSQAPPTSTASDPPPRAEPRRSPEAAGDEALDLGSILARMPAVRYGGLALAALLLLVAVARRRR